MPAPRITVARDTRLDALGWKVAQGNLVIEFASFDEASATARNAGTDLSTYVYGEEEYVPTCSVCDGIHGTTYCPLEDRGWQDSDDEYRRF